MECSAVIYAIGNRLIVGASRRTPTGLRIEVAPQTLSGDADPAELAVWLSNALAASTATAIPPADWKDVFDPFLKAAGVRSLKAFMSSAQSVDIDQTDGAIVVTPNRNLGTKGGFEPILSRAATLRDVEEAASAALQMLRTR